MQRASALRPMAVSLLLAALACYRSARQTHTGAAAALDGGLTGSAAGQACRVPIAGIDGSGWEEISVKGFTFCVPPDGRQVGDSWRSPATRLSWGTNPAGYQASDPAVFANADISSAPHGQAFHRRFREDVGGRKADIQLAHDERFFTAWARWSSPAVWMTAESEAPGSEALQLAIFRSVRFTDDAK